MAPGRFNSGLNQTTLCWAGGWDWQDDPVPQRNTPTPPPSFGEQSPPGLRSGLVCGRFLPPHAGHRHLIEVARQSAGHLTVMVFATARDPIPGSVRAAWLREMFPGVHVLLVDAGAHPIPDSPSALKHSLSLIREHISEGPDDLYASEHTSEALAERLGAHHVPVDPMRTVVPISGEEIRADILARWDFLPDCAKPWFVRRISLIGPSNSGKTTLAQRLAAHYETTWVPEYALTLAETRNGRLDASDVQTIARCQIGVEASAARRARRVLICDTDLLAVRLWSEALFKGCPAWIIEEADKRAYDLTLVTSPTTTDSSAKHLFNRCLQELGRLGRTHVVLSGRPDEQLQTACDTIDALLDTGGLVGARYAL